MLFDTECHQIIDNIVFTMLSFLKDDIIVQNPKLDMVTCMTSGDDMYRTFNGIIFKYLFLCTVGLLESEQIDIYSMTFCDPLNKCTCYKVNNNHEKHEHKIPNKNLYITQIAIKLFFNIIIIVVHHTNSPLAYKIIY